MLQLKNTIAWPHQDLCWVLVMFDELFFEMSSITSLIVFGNNWAPCYFLLFPRNKPSFLLTSLLIGVHFLNHNGNSLFNTTSIWNAPIDRKLVYERLIAVIISEAPQTLSCSSSVLPCFLTKFMISWVLFFMYKNVTTHYENVEKRGLKKNAQRKGS